MDLFSYGTHDQLRTHLGNSARAARRWAMAMVPALASAQPPAPPARLCSGPNCPSVTAPAAADFHPEGYTLTFADEFSDTQLDRTTWCTRYIYGGGSAPPQIRDPTCQRPGEGSLDSLNDEVQRYVDFNRRKERMHVVTDGMLTLSATKSNPESVTPYESAMIRSKRLFAPSAERSYYITARVMMPNIRGTWPAFWLNSDRKPDGTLQWPPEIDIFEGALNEKEDTANMLHHAAKFRGSGKQTATGKREITFYAPEFDPTWNNYVASRSLRDIWLEVAVEWTLQGVCYHIDGYKVMCENYSWVYNQGDPAAPAHILLNLAIGGQWAGRYGIADSRFPARFRIDHVRVYEKHIPCPETGCPSEPAPNLGSRTRKSRGAEEITESPTHASIQNR